MSIEVRVLSLGALQTNCYLISDTATGNALVIDPVDNADMILKTAHEADLTIKLILATHAHFDHVMASKPLKEATNAPFYLHEDEMLWLEQVPQQGMMFVGEMLPEAAQPDRFLTTEPETIELGNIRLETRFTPGHSPGHISFYMPQERILFSGDTLFAGSVGSVSLPHTDYNLLMTSIVEQLLPLGDDVQVLSGHTPPTTIGRERNNNPFILDFLQNGK